MKNTEIIESLSGAKLFAGFKHDELSRIADLVSLKTFQAGEYVLCEDTNYAEVYLIKSGRVKVVAGNNRLGYELAHLQKGDSIGELSIIYNQKATVNIIATETTEVLVINKHDLHRLADADVNYKLANNINAIMQQNNKSMVALLSHELEEKRKHYAVGEFIVHILLLLSFYNLALAAFKGLVNNPYTNMFASTSIIFIFALVLGGMVVRMRYPLASYGLNLHKWRKAIIESSFYTLIIISGITLFKWGLIYGSKLPLFDMQSTVQAATYHSHQFIFWFFSGMLVYAVFVPLQEFISRGVLQSSLQHFLQGRHSNLVANLVTSGVFSAMHIHISSAMAWLTFLPSLFWGWLYTRHKTLISPILSHVLIGWWVIFVLGNMGSVCC